MPFKIVVNAEFAAAQAAQKAPCSPTSDKPLFAAAQAAQKHFQRYLLGNAAFAAAQAAQKSECSNK